LKTSAARGLIEGRLDCLEEPTLCLDGDRRIDQGKAIALSPDSEQIQPGCTLPRSRKGETIVQLILGHYTSMPLVMPPLGATL
jgi:hypothetical protein